MSVGGETTMAIGAWQRPETRALLELAAQAGAKMGPLLRIEHAVIRASDVERSVDWYGRALGLDEVARDGGCVYLSCGGENGFDLGVVPGGAGLDHFAFSVHDEETLMGIADTLQRAGVTVSRPANGEPEIAAAIRFVVPAADQEMELVVRGYRKPYQLYNEWSPGGATAPSDLNHVTFAGGDPTVFAAFLIRCLGFRLSDVYEPSPGAPLRFAFLRVGENHHDIAMLPAPRVGLHHIAFLVPDVTALAHFADRIHRLGWRGEAGIGRHLPGHNIYFYVRDPDRNRVELLTDIAGVNDRGAGVQLWDYPDPNRGFSVWDGKPAPPSWLEEVT